MPVRLTPPLFILLITLLFFYQLSSGEVQGIGVGVDLVDPIHVVIRSRKLRQFTLDYDYGGANKRHEPKKGKPGINNSTSP